MLLSLFSTLGRERLPEAIEILDLYRGQDHFPSPLKVVAEVAPVTRERVQAIAKSALSTGGSDRAFAIRYRASARFRGKADVSTAGTVLESPFA
jgi:hypothetical protein